MFTFRVALDSTVQHDTSPYSTQHNLTTRQEEDNEPRCLILVKKKAGLTINDSTPPLNGQNDARLDGTGLDDALQNPALQYLERLPDTTNGLKSKSLFNLNQERTGMLLQTFPHHTESYETAHYLTRRKYYRQTNK